MVFFHYSSVAYISEVLIPICLECVSGISRPPRKPTGVSLFIGQDVVSSAALCWDAPRDPAIDRLGMDFRVVD